MNDVHRGRGNCCRSSVIHKGVFHHAVRHLRLAECDSSWVVRIMPDLRRTKSPPYFSIGFV